jgi:hypothetical protein
MFRLVQRAASSLAVVISLTVIGSAASPALTAPPARAAVAAGCPAFPGADAFVARIDNRFLPLIPGSTYHYKGSENGETQRRVLEVTHETKTILGVATVVVRDTVRDRRGDLIEQTLDWFAQDAAGNVWYFGEDSKDYENGEVVSTEGSWEAGVDGAEPGIVMDADPQPGDFFHQECAPGVAEDQAEVVKLNNRVKTPFGTFGRALSTRETTPLEPDVAEVKWYAPCVGHVRTEQVRGGKASEVLVAVRNAPSRSELGCDDSGGQGKGKDRRKGDRHDARDGRDGKDDGKDDGKRDDKDDRRRRR